MMKIIEFHRFGHMNVSYFMGRILVVEVKSRSTFLISLKYVLLLQINH